MEIIVIGHVHSSRFHVAAAARILKCASAVASQGGGQDSCHSVFLFHLHWMASLARKAWFEHWSHICQAASCWVVLVPLPASYVLGVPKADAMAKCIVLAVELALYPKSLKAKSVCMSHHAVDTMGKAEMRGSSPVSTPLQYAEINRTDTSP